MREEPFKLSDAGLSAFSADLERQLYAAHKARQARYAAVSIGEIVAIPKPKPTPVVVSNALEEQRRLRELKKRNAEERAAIEAELKRQCDAAILRAKIAARKYPTVDMIIRLVADEFGVTYIDVISHRKTRGGIRPDSSTDVITPRQVVMYLAKTCTPTSLPEIGRRMGKRDHTTILHGIRRIAARMATDDAFRARVDGLREQFKPQWIAPRVVLLVDYGQP